MLALALLGASVAIAATVAVIRTALGDPPGEILLDAISNAILGLLVGAITAWNAKRRARRKLAIEKVQRQEEKLDEQEAALAMSLLAAIPEAAHTSDVALSLQPERAYSIRQMSTEELAQRIRNNQFEHDALPVVAGIPKERTGSR